MSTPHSDDTETLRFRGPTVEAALDAAEKSIGGRVQLISANRLRRGGIGGFFASDMGVEIAVTPEHETIEEALQRLIDGTSTEERGEWNRQVAASSALAELAALFGELPDPPAPMTMKVPAQQSPNGTQPPQRITAIDSSETARGDRIDRSLTITGPMAQRSPQTGHAAFNAERATPTSASTAHSVAQRMVAEQMANDQILAQLLQVEQGHAQRPAAGQMSFAEQADRLDRAALVERILAERARENRAAAAIDHAPEYLDFTPPDTYAAPGSERGRSIDRSAPMAMPSDPTYAAHQLDSRETAHNGHAAEGQFDSRYNGQSLTAGGQPMNGSAAGGHVASSHPNGQIVNGHALNGHTMDSRAESHAVNGRAPNGHAMDSHAANGHAINGHVMGVHVVDGNAVNGHAINGHVMGVHVVDGNAVNGHAIHDRAMNGQQLNGPAISCRPDQGWVIDDSARNGSAIPGAVHTAGNADHIDPAQFLQTQFDEAQFDHARFGPAPEPAAQPRVTHVDSAATLDESPAPAASRTIVAAGAEASELRTSKALLRRHVELAVSAADQLVESLTHTHNVKSISTRVIVRSENHYEVETETHWESFGEAR